MYDIAESRISFIPLCNVEDRECRHNISSDSTDYFAIKIPRLKGNINEFYSFICHETSPYNILDLNISMNNF